MLQKLSMKLDQQFEEPWEEQVESCMMLYLRHCWSLTNYAVWVLLSRNFLFSDIQFSARQHIHSWNQALVLLSRQNNVGTPIWLPLISELTFPLPFFTVNPSWVVWFSGAEALAASIAAVTKYGGASAGYRTLLDALLPASSVLQEVLTIRFHFPYIIWMPFYGVTYCAFWLNRN